MDVFYVVKPLFSTSIYILYIYIFQEKSPEESELRACDDVLV